METVLSPELLLSQGRQDLEGRLSYFLSVGGIAVVSGESGVGKTLAVQAFVRSLDPRGIVTVPLSDIAQPTILREKTSSTAAV